MYNVFFFYAYKHERVDHFQKLRKVQQFKKALTDNKTLKMENRGDNKHEKKVSVK